MEPILWILVDEEGLVVLSGGRRSGDIEYLASVIFLGFLSLKKALEGELKSAVREVILPTERYLILMTPMDRLLLFALFPENTALGLARMGMKKLFPLVQRELQRVSRRVPPSPPASPPTGRAIRDEMLHLIQFIREHAPDPAFLLKRVALRTGIPEQRIVAGDLSPDEYQAVRRHVENMLGVEIPTSGD